MFALMMISKTGTEGNRWNDLVTVSGHESEDDAKAEAERLMSHCNPAITTFRVVPWEQRFGMERAA